MTINRLALGVALGVALVVGLWATTPATEPAQAQTPGLPGPTFNCALAGPNGTFLITRLNRPLAESLVLLGQGFVCIPTATDDAAPRFQCSLFPPLPRRLSQATAIIRIGGSCVPIGLPPLSSP